MKVRLGSPIKPNEFFQMLVTSDDDSEIKQAIAPVVCKVDFINSVISNELIQIVENWYKGLKPVEPNNFFQNFISKYDQYAARIAHYLVVGAGLFIVFYFFKIKISDISSFSINKELIITGYFWLILTLIGYLISNLIGSVIGKIVYKTINKIEDMPLFNLTKGDENEVVKVLSKNRKATIKFIFQILLTIFGALLSVFLDRII